MAARGAPVARKMSPIMLSGVQLTRPMRPPDLQTRSNSFAVRSWSGANMAPNVDRTTSKLSSSNGRAWQSATLVVSGSSSTTARAAAWASSSGTKSVAITSPNRRAAASEAAPLPAATSSTRSPARRSTVSHRRSPGRTANRAADLREVAVRPDLLLTARDRGVVGHGDAPELFLIRKAPDQRARFVLANHPTHSDIRLVATRSARDDAFPKMPAELGVLLLDSHDGVVQARRNGLAGALGGVAEAPAATCEPGRDLELVDQCVTFGDRASGRGVRRRARRRGRCRRRACEAGLRSRPRALVEHLVGRTCRRRPPRRASVAADLDAWVREQRREVAQALDVLAADCLGRCTTWSTRRRREPSTLPRSRAPCGRVALGKGIHRPERARGAALPAGGAEALVHFECGAEMRDSRRRGRRLRRGARRRDGRRPRGTATPPPATTFVPAKGNRADRRSPDRIARTERDEYLTEHREHPRFAVLGLESVEVHHLEGRDGGSGAVMIAGVEARQGKAGNDRRMTRYATKPLERRESADCGRRARSTARGAGSV